ncbi:hypothetical protein ABZ322_44120, partial [Streptomyces sp. NPDC006129]|uniref:hypothetical protein n=1 Tax=Streptomyces sp. NPDC006129 TaxID=3155348 RepID=UPI0033B7CB96
PGWRAEGNLPFGVTVTDVIEKRERLASGLRRRSPKLHARRNRTLAETGRPTAAPPTPNPAHPDAAQAAAAPTSPPPARPPDRPQEP